MGRAFALAGLLAMAAAQAYALDTTMVQLIERYSADLNSLRRTWPHDLLPATTARWRAYYTEQQGLVAKIDPSKLDRDGKLDHLLMANELEKNLRDLDLDRGRWDEALHHFPLLSDLTQLDEDQLRAKKVVASRAADLLATVPVACDKALAAMEKSKPTAGVASRVVRAVNRAESAMQHWYGFYTGYDPTFTWWCQEPYKAAKEALDKFKNNVREKILKLPADDRESLVGDPVGRDALMSDLAAERIPYTPEELVAIGERELAWCHAEMTKAAREMGCKDWKEAIEKVKQMHVDPGDQPAMIRELAQEAVEFLEARDLVTIPALAKEDWRMEMMSAEAQLKNPFFLGGESIIVSFPTDKMAHEAKLMSLRGNNRYFSRATVQHELIPGHHLQGFMQERYHPYRYPFGTPFWVEGWALYWELRLWDLGFASKPEEKMGMLFWRAHRCARIVFSLKYHLGQMTPEQCVDMLVDQVGHERRNAEAEVRRSFAGDYPPLYQLAYLIGGLQIRALHNELVPSKMTEKQFHDTVLQTGSIPIAYLRAYLHKEPMPKAVLSDWRFAG
ncbi:MAG: DUF885 domain-containing protein [Armatimonadetes bacterium]|nr:DUF885 domain-containing protein [Armatimonadota bacterium]